jgi:hypothetical protein
MRKMILAKMPPLVVARYDIKRKRYVTASALWILGVQGFYLRQPGNAVGQLLLTGAAGLTHFGINHIDAQSVETFVVMQYIALGALAAWRLVDAFLMGGTIQRLNLSILEGLLALEKQQEQSPEEDFSLTFATMEELMRKPAAQQDDLALRPD